MERNTYQKLLAWKTRDDRKPLVVRGARQVGKTHLIRQFGDREYENLVYLNFEEDAALDGLFDGRLAPSRLLATLSRYARAPIEGGRTLLFLDEIQQSNRALNSLKYFSEQAPEYHVIAAGSLLGVQLSRPGSFPVGKVNLVDLYPMTFLEFLTALDEHALLDELSDDEGIEPLPEVFHRELLDRLATYTFVGGMPEAVRVFAKTADLDAARRVHRELLTGYAADFGKHAPGELIPKLNLVWESVPTQLARENKKFSYSAVAKGARARGYEDALHWLSGAGLIHRCVLARSPTHPLAASADPRSFKVFMHDVGLLGALAGLNSTTLAAGQVFDAFRGAFSENYVAQQLAAAQVPLFYWRSKATAEVDFLFTTSSGEILPLEVKAGINARSKSLRVYQDLYEAPLLLRTTQLNRRLDGRILNTPLYAINHLDALARRCQAEELPKTNN